MTLLDFFQTGAKLKQIPRQGWIDKLHIKRPESVADHSYMTALISMVVSDMGWAAACDTQKVIKMALLHDLAEARTGDITPEEMDVSQKRQLEDDAFGQILEALPEPVRGQYQQIWQEYRMQESTESKMVHQIDRLEMALQAMTYRHDNGHSKESIEPFICTANTDITYPKIQDLLKDIVKNL